MLTGGCFCGAIRYETSAEPFHETICHCEDCRRAVGAHAVAWFSVPRAALVLKGEPTRFQSSARAVRSFCGLCGTSLLYESDAQPGEVDITLASLDQPNVVPPKDHTMAAGKLGWDLICDGLPSYARLRPGQ